MSFLPRPQEIYKHFKGNLYQITAVAQHTETGEQLVIYQALYGDFKIYARPLAMFLEKVDKEKYPDAVQEFRFELQGSDEKRQAKQRGEAARNRVEESEVAESEVAGSRDARENAPDPLVLEFLDADSYEQKLNILTALHHRITDEMITTMAISCDIEVNDGAVEERYEAFRGCLLTLERYECKRLQ